MRDSSQKNTDICISCDAKVKRNDEGLKCDSCERWFHIACEGVGKAAYKALKDHEELLWLCGGCKKENITYRNMRKEVEDLVDEKIKKMEEKMYIDIKEKISGEILAEMKAEWMVEVTRLKTDLMQEVTSIKHKLDQIGIDISTRPAAREEKVTVEEVKSTVLQEMEEAEDRKRRACNVVIYNIPESTSDETDDRISEDTNWCLEMCEKTLEVEVNREDIDNIIRLGKRTENGEDKPRPILLRLKNEKTKWEILGNAKKLRNANSQVIKKIGITKDMTKKEREENSKIRKELKEKQDRGEKGWMIKNGKLTRAEGVRRRV